MNNFEVIKSHMKTFRQRLIEIEKVLFPQNE